MWTKIYLALLLISIVVVGSISYYAALWLSSVGNPADAVAGFERNAALAWPLLWITSAVLMIPANAVLWSTRKAWSLWATFCYFAVFLFINSLWLTPAARNFAQEKGFPVEAALIGPFTAVIMILLACAIVFLDQFIVLRMRDKTLAPKEESSEHEAAAIVKE